MNRLSAAGAACQSFLQDLRKEIPSLPAPSEFDRDPNGLANWLREARKVIEPVNSEVQSGIAIALDSKAPASAKNVRETIRYSLLGRGGNQSLDLYGLLKSAGPYTWIEPGQEWLVTVASLCAPGPGKPTRACDTEQLPSRHGRECFGTNDH